MERQNTVQIVKNLTSYLMKVLSYILIQQILRYDIRSSLLFDKYKTSIRENKKGATTQKYF